MSGDWDETELGGSVEWLTMLEAANCLAASRSLTARAAKESILDLMADGQLHLRCQKHFEERDVGPINWWHRGKQALVVPKGSDTSVASHRPPPSAKRFRPTTMAPSYWLQRDGWSIDQARVDWLSSSVVATKPSVADGTRERTSPIRHLRRAANGIEIMRDPMLFPLTPSELVSRRPLHRTEVEAQPEPCEQLKMDGPAIAPEVPERRKGGRTPSEDWNEWIAELTLYIHESGYDQSLSKEKQYAIIRDRLHKRNLESPGYAKVEKALGAVKRRWIEYKEKEAEA